jgi:hypothetical protein
VTGAVGDESGLESYIRRHESGLEDLAYVGMIVRRWISSWLSRLLLSMLATLSRGDQHCYQVTNRPGASMNGNGKHNTPWHETSRPASSSDCSLLLSTDAHLDASPVAAALAPSCYRHRLKPVPPVICCIVYIGRPQTKPPSSTQPKAPVLVELQ